MSFISYSLAHLPSLTWVSIPAQKRSGCMIRRAADTRTPDLWSDPVILRPATPFSAAETSGEKPSSGSRVGKPCFCDFHVIPANSPCLGHIPLGLAETMLEKYWCNRVWPGHQCWDGSLTGWSSKEWFCRWWRCVSTSRSSNEWLDACHAASEGGFRITDEKITRDDRPWSFLILLPANTRQWFYCQSPR
jgi:hypothetical protein